MKYSIFFFLTSSIALSQGPLNPLGAPAPMMKTLDQIESRTPIAFLPFTITTPGSYYFTRNLEFTALTGNSITIATNNVTLDLNGFTLISTAEVTGNAIQVDNQGTAGLSNIAIKNGKIAGNTTVTVTENPTNRTWSVSQAGFSTGIKAQGLSSRNLIVDQIQVTGCRSIGISASGGSVINCPVSSNGSIGINAFEGSVTNCTASSNGGTGIFSSSVTNCIARYNSDTGISSSVVMNCVASSNGDIGIQAYRGSVANCMASSNGGNGIDADQGSVTNSTTTSNRKNGISANYGSVTNCTASFNNTSSTAGVVDLNATEAVIAFTRFGKGNTTGCTLTGTKSP